MTRADDVHHVQVILFDQPVEVHIKKVEPRRRTPMAEQTRLDVVERQGHLKQSIVLQINLPDRQIIGGAPIGVHLLEEVRRQGTRGVGLRLWHCVHGGSLTLKRTGF